MVKKLAPNDPRVQRLTATVRGFNYSYLLSEPTSAPKDTIFLVHGFPDLSYGWRHQIPYFTELGYRVICPDMLGYGQTSSPHAVEEYTLKKLSSDVNELARKYVGEKGQIILGGHDWGGALVWRVALWFPELIKGVFSICTPYHAPAKSYKSLEDIIAAGSTQNFTYQLHFKGPEVEAHCQGEEGVRQFLNCLHGGQGPNGEVAFRPQQGVAFENLPKLRRSLLLSQEDLDHYTSEYMRHPAPQLRGPLNWYRTRELNFKDEKPLADKGVKLDMPALFVSATRDKALPPEMSRGMEVNFAKLERGEVESSHWALTQAADEVNKNVGAWLEKLDTIKSSL